MSNDSYQRFADSLAWLSAHYTEQPSLEQIAEPSGLSMHHFQRQFTQWVGVSPKRFVESLSVDHARELLAQGASVLDASLDAGLSSPSRLHDLFIRHEALSPGEYKSGGAGLEVVYGLHDTPFGQALLAQCGRGLLALAFVEASEEADSIVQMKKRLPRASYVRDQALTAGVIEQIFSPVEGGELRLLLAGSPFQIQVWRALLQLPLGVRCSYSNLACAVDSPRASRAVGTAVGANPLALLIPCHRVIRADTGLGGYRWGLQRKLAVQAWELGLQA